MRPRAIAFGVACAALAACGGKAVAPSAAPLASGAPRTPVGAIARKVEVQGHRGARANFPEDTLPAFEHALAVGVDTLELDVAVTKDGALVVMHDLAINPSLCLGPGGERIARGPHVATLTLNEVRAYDCGSLKNERFPAQTPVPGTRIPTLGEVFELVVRSTQPAAAQVAFNIETKSLPARPELTPPAEVFAKKILDEARAHGMLPRVTIQSFDHRTLVAAKRLEPRVKIAALVEGTLPDLAHLAAGLHADVISPNVDWITAEDVRALHARGVRVVPWTANTPEQWDYLVRIGVDGIISDDPAPLLAFLAQRNLR